MLEVQKFLRSGKTIQELEDLYAIKAKRHSDYNNLILFKYNQIDSNFSEQIVRECRGIILDEDNDWNIVSFPFTKFFNYGEGNAATIDWNSARCQEKADGSLSTIYFHDNQWIVSTSGTPDANGEVNDFGISFKDYFWETWEIYEEDLNSLPKDVCFMFELTGPRNRVVVQHKGQSLTFLGARNIKTLEEISSSRKFFKNIPSVKEYKFSTIEEVLEALPLMNPLKQEGFVIVDGNFNRIKCKCAAYIALHHLKDRVASRKALVEVVRAGEASEVLAAFPEFATVLGEASERLKSLTLSLEAAFDRLKDIPEQKAFALEAVKTRCSAALFQVRRGKSKSIKEYIRDMRIDTLMELLEY